MFRKNPRGLRICDVLIAGYLVANDVSVRDWQLRTPTMTMGKSFDTHGPMVPWLVTPDEVGDPHALELRTWVNGELRQHSDTRELIFDCFAQVEHLSAAFTLEPGDVVTTGTPSGVGGAKQPPRFLQAGDVVKIEIWHIGAIENRVIEEPAETAKRGRQRHAALHDDQQQRRPLLLRRHPQLLRHQAPSQEQRRQGQHGDAG
jgi:hypothetical protein